MSSNARKREKHRLKREKKKREMRRAESVSPFRRAAGSTDSMRCYVTKGWRDNGLADFVVVGQLPSGMLTLSAFTVDIWCVGLKDAWGRAQLGEDDLQERVLEPWRERVEKIEIVDADLVRKYVAGAVRFSRQNGFRLPDHWQRFTAILGDLGDISAADLSDFGRDGGLLYVGKFDFLRKRLIGCTVEEFLNRPDVKYTTDMDATEFEEVFDDGEFADDLDDEEEIDARLDDPKLQERVVQVKLAICRDIAEGTRRWCLANNLAAAPNLVDGANVLFASLAAVHAMQRGLTPDEEDHQVRDAIRCLINHAPTEEFEDLRAATDQVCAFYKSFPSAEQFVQAINRWSDAPSGRFVDAELVSEAATSPSQSANPPARAEPRAS